MLSKTSVLVICAVSSVLGSSTKPSGIKWKSCGEGYPPTLQCGELDVPMDHDNPHLGEIKLGIARIPASGSKVLGNLFVNHGGPGVSELSILMTQASTASAGGTTYNWISKDVADHFNLIGPDPRGIGLTNPIKCDISLWNQRVMNHPSTKTEYDAMVTANKEIGESCAKMTGRAFDFMDTLSVAKDFDKVREALGDEKLNFLGFSYATVIGTLYAEQFPDRVGRMVLDGNVDHGQSEVATIVTDSVGLELTLDHFFTWCATNSTCALHGEDVSTLFDEMVTKANVKPIPAPSCLTPEQAAKQNKTSCSKDVTGWELISGVKDGLTFPDNPVTGTSWTSFSHDLKLAIHGDASAFSTQLATSNTSTPLESIFPFIAISCQDKNHFHSSFAEIRAKQIAVQAVAPHTRGVSEDWDAQTRCIGWPSSLRNPQRRLDSAKMAKAPPILLVNSFWDPATSITGSVDLRMQMPNAVSVFRNGSGHTSYYGFGDAHDAMDYFLITGKLPKDGTIYNS